MKASNPFIVPLHTLLCSVNGTVLCICGLDNKSVSTSSVAVYVSAWAFERAYCNFLYLVLFIIFESHKKISTVAIKRYLNQIDHLNKLTVAYGRQ